MSELTDAQRDFMNQARADCFDGVNMRHIKPELLANGAFRSGFVAGLEFSANTVGLSDADGRVWHLMKRDNGSICLYWTRADNPAQYVVWDSLDNA